MDHDVLVAGERALRPRWPDAALSDPTALEGSPRSRVLRCRVAGADVATVVVKTHLAAEDSPATEREAAVREPAALSLLVGRPGFVQLLGVAQEPPTVVMADLGAPGDVAELLLGTDPGAARAGVIAWARAVAQLHSASVGAGPRFEAALAEHAGRLGRPRPAADVMPRMLTHAAEQLAEHAPELGVHPTQEALDELRGLDELLVRHIAWDAAYLTVPWPSCWCSWRLDTAVVAGALDAYREAVDIPYVRTAAFEDDLRAATEAWALVSTSWFLERALVEDHTQETDSAVMPPRRAMISHRLAGVNEPRLPALTSLAQQLLAATRARWGDVPLALAPAFRGG